VDAASAAQRASARSTDLLVSIFVFLFGWVSPKRTCKISTAARVVL